MAPFRSPGRARGDKLIRRNPGGLTIWPEYAGDEVCIVSDPLDVVPDEKEFFLEYNIPPDGRVASCME